jgi:hypothetical protein
LIVFGLVGELSHEPICLYQPNSDPLAKPYVYTAAKKHGKGVVANPAAPNCGATEQCVHKGLNYWQACGEYGADGIGVNRSARTSRIVHAKFEQCATQQSQPKTPAPLDLSIVTGHQRKELRLLA